MPLYHSSNISVSTSVELAASSRVTYEIDPDNDRVTFSFGTYQDYMLDLTSRDLRRMIELGGQALQELAEKQAEEQAEAACGAS